MSNKPNQPRPPKFTLDISSATHTPKKFKCPKCNQKRFVKFIDLATGNYLDGDYGRCDREEHCGYFLSPYTAGAEIPGSAQQTGYNPPPAPAKLSAYVSKEIVKQSLAAYDRNILVAFFRQTLGPDHTAAILSRYFIGTAKDGSTLFWQIDRTMRARTAVKILYKSDGHRDKTKAPTKIGRNDENGTWYGYTTGNGYFPCLFGEHLFYTTSDSCPVILVESEKTACIASAYLPRINGVPVLWLACSGTNGLADEKIQVLTGKDIILCPDFSFHARATWGLLPMRKKLNNNNVLVPDESGEEIPDFVSLSARLRAKSCRVRFFDPCPSTKDSSDIADFLLQSGPPPPLYEVPDFSQLELPMYPPAENAPLSNAYGANPADFGAPALTHTTGPIPFKIGRNENSGLFAQADTTNGAEFLNKFLNKPEISALIEGCGFEFGELIPPGCQAHAIDIFAITADRVKQSREAYSKIKQY